jgi:hypothetical protein
VVVAVGLTLVEPLANVEVNVPGVMAMLVAPLVAQLSVLLESAFTLVGLAVKEVIAGAFPDEIGATQPVNRTQTNRTETRSPEERSLRGMELVPRNALAETTRCLTFAAGNAILARNVALSSPSATPW